NVQDSARAAQEVSDRIVEVAQEAANTGKQAAVVEAMLDDMAAQVDKLGHVLTQVVRTATPDVNRRSAPRYPVNAKATLSCGHGEFEGELTDISVCGARLTGLPGGDPGQHCTLRVDGVQVGAVVVESKGGTCRLKMEDGRVEAVERWISRRVETGKAAA
ncbi:MAG: PilZ domain-containing protein, partial [Magnetospirillum sp.]